MTPDELERVKRLVAELDEVVTARLLQRDRLRAENAAMRQALEWYASPRTWNQWCPESFAKRAREVLATVQDNSSAANNSLEQARGPRAPQGKI